MAKFRAQSRLLPVTLPGKITGDLYTIGNVAASDSASQSNAGGSSQTNTALKFDGVNDYINCGSGINLANKSFTVEFWAKREVIDGKQQLLVSLAQQSYPALNYGLLIGFRGGNNFFMAFWGNAIDTNDPYTDQNWHHWACTYNSSNRQQEIYLDGVLIKTRIADSHCLASGEFRLGCNFSQSEKFKGILGEVRIWNKVRTASEFKGI